MKRWLVLVAFGLIFTVIVLFGAFKFPRGIPSSIFGLLLALHFSSVVWSYKKEVEEAWSYKKEMEEEEGMKSKSSREMSYK